MFIGHYAPALVAATMPKAPRLGTLFIAAQLVDLAFFLFVLGGIEKMRLTPGITVMNSMDLYHMPYTHSLLGSIAFGAAMAAVVWLVTKNKTAAPLAGLVVVSHWFVDLLVHAPDLTLAGSPPMLGLGLWNYPLVEMPLELGITGAALGYYLSRNKVIAGAILKPVYWLGGAMLALQLYNWLAPEPEAVDASMPILALAAFGIFIWLAYRVDAARTKAEAKLR